MVFNFSWVIPQKLAGSAMPFFSESSGDIPWLATQGIKELISLARPDGPVEQICRDAGINWRLYEIEDYSVPQDLDDFSSFIESVIESIDEKKPCCVHCQAGIGRTGLVLACIAGRYLSLGKEASVNFILERRSAIETNEQMRFIGEYLGQYENRI